MSRLAFIIILLASTAAFAVKVGDAAPDFTAKNQDGKTVKLSEFKGKNVLLYFYPKDETPGCTKEACNFRDEFATLQKHNTVIFGISKQGEESHKSFKEHHKIPFDLLVDDGSLSKLYGVKEMPIVGLLKRQSVLVGPNGRVVKFYDDVDPSKHADEVIKDVEKLEKSQSD